MYGYGYPGMCCPGYGYNDGFGNNNSWIWVIIIVLIIIFIFCGNSFRGINNGC
ncbi:MAG: sporulation protein YjcZ [bacterium]|nr:sporulation protein YjcZ [bacterium]